MRLAGRGEAPGVSYSVLGRFVARLAGAAGAMLPRGVKRTSRAEQDIGGK